VAPEYGITVAAVYHPVNGQLVEVQGAGGTSAADAPKSVREQEAKLADGWFKTITGEIFG
jgi:glycine cleavage system H lipoate-binding protein